MSKVETNWHCSNNCKDIIALNVGVNPDGRFICLYCGGYVAYRILQITPDQLRRRFGLGNIQT